VALINMLHHNGYDHKNLSAALGRNVTSFI
jgi:hypothetical protein